MKVSDAFRDQLIAAIPSLRAFAVSLCGNATRADDLVQETLVKAWANHASFEPGTNLRAWLFTILHNTALNRARDRSRETVAVDSEIVDRAADAPPPGGVSAGAAETPESLLIRETLAPELQAAIDALPEAFRQAVWLRDVEEFSYAEIAAMLSIPIGTVMSRISRGRHMLFERLNHLRPVNA